MSNLDDVWSRCSPEELSEFAGRWEDMVTSTQPEELDWLYIAKLPVAALWSKEDAEEYWKEQSLEAAENGMPGMWDALLDEPVFEPIVVGFYGRHENGHDSFSIWDGSHRSAAYAITDRPNISAVIGITKKLDLDELPGLIRPVVAARREELNNCALPTTCR
ncbi:hypothetical protein [Thalassospira xiamenensis]|uniref:Uncharacterized protein n=1 Tax=Thalassospira xiamenensis TaxID=220697 RepID=A0A285TXZ0_9PROT|nr:hypothetical protein [Thalassospira xiamenensis]SOC30340.1 hypothetical protein SAMN05428964_10910 [Thalassospira xiamenensis]